MVFYVPSELLRRDLCQLVNSGGGIVVGTLDCEEVAEAEASSENPVYTIVDGSTCTEEVPNPLKVDFIFDCLKKGKLLPAIEYRLDAALHVDQLLSSVASQDSVDRQLLNLLSNMDSPSSEGRCNQQVCFQATPTGGVPTRGGITMTTPTGGVSTRGSITRTKPTGSVPTREVDDNCMPLEGTNTSDREMVRRDLFKDSKQRCCPPVSCGSRTTEAVVNDTLEVLQEKLIRLYIDQGRAFASFEEKSKLLAEYTDFSFDECSSALYVVSGDIREALCHLFHLQTVHCWEKDEDQMVLSLVQKLSQELGGLSLQDIANRINFLAQHTRGQ